MDTRLTDDLGILESLSKFLALALAVLYLVGFLVVASYLLRYGVSSFSVLQLQYLIAGAWVIGPPTLYTWIRDTTSRFELRAAPDPKGTGIFSWPRFVLALFFSGIPGGIFLILLAIIPNFFENLTWGIGWRILLFYIAMTWIAQLFWISRKRDPEKETKWVNRTHAAPFYLAFLLVIVIGYAVWFSIRIYPLIPFSLGGGRPLTVVFIEGDKKMPDEIQRPDPASKRSIPYQLLLSTDHYYVVISPSEGERSMEVSRESVAGIVVLQ